MAIITTKADVCCAFRDGKSAAAILPWYHYHAVAWTDVLRSNRWDARAWSGSGKAAFPNHPAKTGLRQAGRLVFSTICITAASLSADTQLPILFSAPDSPP